MLSSHPRLADALLVLARPALRIHLQLYRRDVERSPFPRGEVDRLIEGPDQDRLLFVGDIVVAGYGVLDHGMTSVVQVASATARDRQRGLAWDAISATDLALKTVARDISLHAQDADAVVLMLGIPDVLLGTRSASWSRDLKSVIDRVRRDAGPACGIVIAAIPPMADFQELPPVGRELISGQVERLNRASEAVAAAHEGVSFVPFPSWRIGSMFIRDSLSWSAMHRLWATEISPFVTAALVQCDDIRAAPGASAGAASAGAASDVSAG